MADSPQAIAAGRWCYEQLLNGTATNSTQCFPQNLAAGKTVIDIFGLCSMVQIATELRGFEWDFWPMPSMPQGPYTDAGPDSYVIPANSKHPKEAWELLHWMVSGTHWQTWQMKTMLGAPVLNSLWNQYYTTLRSVAPPLAHKDLEILNSLGHIHIRDDFKYNDPAATKILKTFGQSIQARKMTVAQAFPLMTAQINALETAQGRSQGKTAKPTARAGARATAKPAPA